MRVLVTGHHGYIGSVLAPLAAAAGHEVTGLDSFFYRGCDLGPPVEWIPALDRDVRDVATTDLTRFDAVVHLAALSNDPVGDLNASWTYDINLDGSVNLARRAKEAGVKRFVFASSCSMYGAAAGDELVTEQAPLRPLTAYAESKVRAEEALFELADDDFVPVSMRNATAYGASPRLRLDIVLNNLVGWAHTTGKVKLQSDGSAWRPLVHVRDITAVAIALLDAPAPVVRAQAFNIGSAEQNYRIRDLAEVVREVMPHCDVTFAEDAGPDPQELSGRLRQAPASVSRAQDGVDGAARRERARRGLHRRGADPRGFRGRPLRATPSDPDAARRWRGRRHSSTYVRRAVVRP